MYIRAKYRQVTRKGKERRQMEISKTTICTVEEEEEEEETHSHLFLFYYKKETEL